MNRLVCFLVVFAGLVTAASAQTFASIDALLAAQRRDLAKECKDVDFAADFLTRPNIDGDGRDDALIDFGGLLCEGASSSLFCGSAGCAMELYLQDTNGGFTQVGALMARGVDFDKPGDPSFIAYLHGNECARSGIEPCNIRYAIRNGALVEIGEVPAAEE